MAPLVVARISRPPALTPPRLEGAPGDVPRDRRVVEIIHAGTAQVAVRHVEGRRFDDLHRHAEAGGQAQHGAGVLRDVRLVDGEAGHAIRHRGKNGLRQGWLARERLAGVGLRGGAWPRRDRRHFEPQAGTTPIRLWTGGLGRAKQPPRGDSQSHCARVRRACLFHYGPRVPNAWVPKALPMRGSRFLINAGEPSGRDHHSCR